MSTRRTASSHGRSVSVVGKLLIAAIVSLSARWWTGSKHRQLQFLWLSCRHGWGQRRQDLIVLSRALRHHELRQGILGKLVQDVTVGTLCCGKIASLELLRGLPGHRAQLLIPIADLQVRIVTGSNSEQFIDPPEPAWSGTAMHPNRSAG